MSNKVKETMVPSHVKLLKSNDRTTDLCTK